MTDLQAHVEAPGRAELVKQVAEKISDARSNIFTEHNVIALSHWLENPEVEPVVEFKDGAVKRRQGVGNPDHCQLRLFLGEVEIIINRRPGHFSLRDFRRLIR